MNRSDTVPSPRGDNARDRVTIERDGRLHPTWCTHDTLSECDEHPDDTFIWHFGDEVPVPTERGTTITLQLRWWESLAMKYVDETTPYVGLGGDDGAGFLGITELQGADAANVAIALASLSHQMTSSGWLKQSGAVPA